MLLVTDLGLFAISRSGTATIRSVYGTGTTLKTVYFQQLCKNIHFLITELMQYRIWTTGITSCTRIRIRILAYGKWLIQNWIRSKMAKPVNTPFGSVTKFFISKFKDNY
jgi:hypothetical protein